MGKSKGLVLKLKDEKGGYTYDNCYLEEKEYDSYLEFKANRKIMYEQLYAMVGFRNIKEHRLYNIYTHMKGRCYNPNRSNYKYYGARGIEVCEEWKHSLGAYFFIAWALDNGYEDGLTLDRINVDGNYEPNNCRWVDMKVQCNNKGNNRIIRFNNEEHTLIEWGEITGFGWSAIQTRIDRYGWTIEEALTTSTNVHKKKKRRISNYISEKAIPVARLDDDGNIIEVFPSANHAMQNIGTKSSISTAIRNHWRADGNYWKKISVDEYEKFN